jgi:hypothetical protein
MVRAMKGSALTQVNKGWVTLIIGTCSHLGM